MAPQTNRDIGIDGDNAHPDDHSSNHIFIQQEQQHEMCEKPTGMTTNTSSQELPVDGQVIQNDSSNNNRTRFVSWVEWLAPRRYGEEEVPFYRVQDRAMQNRIYCALIGLTFVAWMFAMISIFHCSLLRIGDASLSYQSLDHWGIYSTPIYYDDYDIGDPASPGKKTLRGCVAYQKDQISYTGVARLVRALAIFFFFSSTGAVVAVPTTILFATHELLRYLLMLCGRFFLVASMGLAQLLLLAYRLDDCRRDDTICRPGGAGIVHIFNCVFLVVASILAFIVPRPEQSFFVPSSMLPKAQQNAKDQKDSDQNNNNNNSHHDNPNTLDDDVGNKIADKDVDNSSKNRDSQPKTVQPPPPPPLKKRNREVPPPTPPPPQPQQKDGHDNRGGVPPITKDPADNVDIPQRPPQNNNDVDKDSPTTENVEAPMTTNNNNPSKINPKPGPLLVPDNDKTAVPKSAKADPKKKNKKDNQKKNNGAKEKRKEGLGAKPNESDIDDNISDGGKTNQKAASNDTDNEEEKADGEDAFENEPTKDSTKGARLAPRSVEPVPDQREQAKTSKKSKEGKLKRKKKRKKGGAKDQTDKVKNKLDPISEDEFDKQDDDDDENDDEEEQDDDDDEVEVAQKPERIAQRAPPAAPKPGGGGGGMCEKCGTATGAEWKKLCLSCYVKDRHSKTAALEGEDRRGLVLRDPPPNQTADTRRQEQVEQAPSTPGRGVCQTCGTTTDAEWKVTCVSCYVRNKMTASKKPPPSMVRR